ncbi:outer membrane usher protein FimD/PapC [Klebsiella oxytoca]|uniref:Outer membrane usher protein FimD/PapC n=1 Tax=Klebsiella oxytoca TaxID=571 RepID=A0A318FKD8_KLEOX|nr:TcfC E-set like domain-containing protein [Klebsiella oxytoca]PXW43950.1 outer membrane usher protein FimD/PapC [Klebsiella oxytoca]
MLGWLFRKGMLLPGICLFCSVDVSAGDIAGQETQLRVGDYIIPPVFADALKQGMRVPVFIRYKETELPMRSRQKIADALIATEKGALTIRELTLVSTPDNLSLSAPVEEIVNGLQDQTFSDDMTLHLSDAAQITFDVRAFYLEMTVDRSALAATTLARHSSLGNSTASTPSNVLNYTFGTYHHRYNGYDGTSSYLTLDNTSAIREHHLNLNGSFYGIGSANSSGNFYRAMYERDMEGNRLALGMVDTWNLQSIASMNALNSSRIYGVSYGNKSNSRLEDTTLSLTPITVFLPAAGEVHVLRDGKLLSIQNFAMGSYEVNTATLPFGIYNVEVQVIINGKVASSRNEQINKTYARRSSVSERWSWQVFGGLLEYHKTDYRPQNAVREGKQETWLSGGAAAVTFPWLAGTSFKSTVYGFDSNAVNESEIDVMFNEHLRANQQVLLANDGSRKSITTLNLSLPAGYGSLWGSREFTHIGNHLPLRKGDYFTYGATLPLQSLTPYLGSLTFSRTENYTNKTRYNNLDYSQTLASGRYGTVTLRTGVQNYHYQRDQDTTRDKYVNLDFSLPLAAWFSAGLSSENGNMLANMALRKRFTDSTITQTGLSASQRVKSKESESYRSDKRAVNGFLSYDSKYSSGTLSATHASDNSTNINFSTLGSVAWAGRDVVPAKGSFASGVLIHTDFSDNATMTAKINGQHYPLSGKKNFIPLPAYGRYSVELMNDKRSADSVDIVSGRNHQSVLYPGNVEVIRPEIKQLVTVFGRIRRDNGTVAAHLDIHNHIGRGRTDGQGEFAMDVDKRYPTITLVERNGSRCELELNLQEARGAVWMGDLQCESQIRMAAQGEGQRGTL